MKKKRTVKNSLLAMAQGVDPFSGEGTIRFLEIIHPKSSPAAEPVPYVDEAQR